MTYRKACMLIAQSMILDDGFHVKGIDPKIRFHSDDLSEAYDIFEESFKNREIYYASLREEGFSNAFQDAIEILAMIDLCDSVESEEYPEDPRWKKYENYVSAKNSRNARAADRALMSYAVAYMALGFEK